MALSNNELPAKYNTHQNEALPSPFSPIACFVVILSLSGAACGWLAHRKGRNKISAAPQGDVLVMAAKHGLAGCVIVSKYPERSVYSPGDVWSMSSGCIRPMDDVTNTALPSILVTPPSPPKSDPSIGSCGDLLLVDDDPVENDKLSDSCPSFDRSHASSDEGDARVDDLREDGSRQISADSFEFGERTYSSKNDIFVNSESPEASANPISIKADTIYEQPNSSVDSKITKSCIPNTDGGDNKDDYVFGKGSISATNTNPGNTGSSNTGGSLSCSQSISALPGNLSLDCSNTSNLPSNIGTNSNADINLCDNSHDTTSSKHKQNVDLTSNVSTKRTRSLKVTVPAPDFKLKPDLVFPHGDHLPDFTDVFPVDEIPLAEASVNTEHKVYTRSQTFPVKSRYLNDRDTRSHLSAKGLSASSGFLNPNSALYNHPGLRPCHSTGSSHHKLHRLQEGVENVHHRSDKHTRGLSIHQEHPDLFVTSSDPSHSALSHHLHHHHPNYHHQQHSPHLSAPPGGQHLQTAEKNAQVITHPEGLQKKPNTTVISKPPSTADNTDHAAANTPLHKNDGDNDKDDFDDDFDLAQCSPRPRLSSMEPGTRKTDFKFKRPKKS